MMADLPYVTLRVVGSTESTSALIRTQRVFAVIDGEVVGEVNVKSAEVRLEAGTAPMVRFETFVGPRFAEIDLRPNAEIDHRMYRDADSQPEVES